MRFQPRHLIALAAITALAIVLQPVASQAAGSLVTLVGGPGDYQARVTSQGALVVEAQSRGYHSDVTIAPGATVMADTAGCRATQIYAYPVYVGKQPPAPEANTLTTALFLAATADSPTRTLTVASWDSGTPADAGEIRALTRTAVQETLRLRVGKGTYRWRVVVDCLD